MEKTNFTFVSPRVWMGALAAVFFMLTGLQTASAQCPTPTGLTTLNIGQNSATLRWTSNSTPTDNCWVVTVGGQGLASCNNAGQATIQTTVCYINNVVSFSAPVTGMTVIGSQISVTVGGLQPGTDYEFFVTENCDGIGAPLNVSACAGPAAFITLDAQYTVSATTVKPSCPFVSPGYVPNGSFTVNVTDGTTCAGTYTVNATPIAGSGPAGSTPPSTTVVTYIGFPQGAYLFANAGAGCYTVTVTETGTCNPPVDPVVIVVCVPDGMDMVQPVFYVTDVLGNILADNDPLTAQGVTRNFGTVAIPEGECGRQDEYYVYGFDNCDGFITAINAVSASAATTPASIAPGTQVSVTPDGFGFYLVDVHWSTGTSTVTILGRDAAGNIANSPAGLQLIMNVPDNTVPVVSILSNSQFTIPVCATSVTGIVTFQVDDACDQIVNFANLVVNFGGATGVLNFTGTNYREYLVTFPAAGNYLISAGYTDANNNFGFIDQVIQVQLAAANQPPTIQANAETVTLTACQSSATIVYSFTISDDCAPINNAQVQFNGGGSGLPNLNGSGFFFTDDVGPNTRYFEVQGTVSAGTFFPLITYQGVTANPTITVLQNGNQAADIVLPGNLIFTIPQCATSVDGCMAIQIFDDCDNPIVPARASFTLGGAALTPTFINAPAGYFEFCRTFTAADNGDLLVATYTDAQGAVRTVDAIITVTSQPDLWAPIIVYPAQDILLALDPCGPNTGMVVFEATATDNCGVASFTASISPAGAGLSISAGSAGGTRVIVIGQPGTYTVLLTATDVFGNVRQEDFRVIITQAPRPATNLACNDNINVTLNANCQALIVPDMVLEGDPGCLKDSDFDIVVVDGNIANGPIVDGCGDFNVEIKLKAPTPTAGFTGAFAPANWTTGGAFNDGASVTFTSSTLTLVTGASGPLDGSDPNLAELDAFASIAFPSGGNLSFNYVWTNVDVNFDWFIIASNGTVLLQGTANAAGLFNQVIPAGAIFVIGIDDDGIAPAGQQLVISNWLFTPTNPYAGIDFTTCWGTIHAEDKTKPVIDCPDDRSTANVPVVTQSITGALATTDPSLNAANFACFQEFSATVNGGTPGIYYYDTYTFTVTQDDTYTFTQSGSFDGMALLYEGAFDPAFPCDNVIAQADENITTGGFIFFVAGVGFNFQNGGGTGVDLRLGLDLTAGQTYTLLTSSFDPATTGNYSYVVTGDNGGQMVGVPTLAAVAVRPLICDDVDHIVLSSLPANVPRCYKTDRLGNVIYPTNQQQRARLQQLLDLLALTGYPALGQPGASVSDNCGFLEVCATDVVQTNGDCGVVTVTRTFSVKDKQDGDYNAPNTTACAGTPNTASCSQIITVRKPNIDNVIFPQFTAYKSCDADFPTDANGNPSADATGYPWVQAAFGKKDINQSYCNLSASYFDHPRAVVCESTYKFRREWTVINWCSPGAGRIYNQLIKVGDFDGADIACPFVDYNWDGIGDEYVYSTQPYNCVAAFQIPEPIITDNCSSWTYSVQIVTDLTVPVLNQYGQQIGTTVQTVVVANYPGPYNENSNLPTVSNIPVGRHRFVYRVEDNCHNVTSKECWFTVKDLVEPVAVCDDDLHISIGGQGYAQVTAEDIDEGSWDNCGDIRIEVRRRYTEDDACNPIPAFFGPWSHLVEFGCCDVHDNVTIELRVWEDADKDGLFGAWHGNPDNNGDGQPDIDPDDKSNVCWLEVLIEDKLKPICIAPHNVTVDCDDLPYNFPTDTDQASAEDTTLLQSLFGYADGTDNCPGVSIKELTPVWNLECGAGTIIRRFSVTDLWGNVSSNTCQQIITINKVHNYEIKFPKDAGAICGDPNPDTIEVAELGCDLLAISVTDDPFSASGDECYKIFRTYRVINWCEYNGQDAPVVVGRDEDCDNNPGDENIWVLVRQATGGAAKITYYDRDNNELNNNPFPFTKSPSCDGRTNPAGYWMNSIQGNQYGNPAIRSRGYWQYTQIIKVYDTIKPEVSYDQPEPFCSYSSDIANGCPAPVEVPFSVDENCTPDDITIKVFLDAFSDGVLDGEITASALSGSYPDYTISGSFPLGAHIFEVHVKDGCGNAEQVDIHFEVVDCKAPTPVCINGLAIELMPVIPTDDVDGDGIDDTGAMAIWASDFIASPIVDCTPPIKYSIHIADEVLDGTDVPSPDQTGIILTCADDATTVIRIYAWDSAYNPYAVQPDGTVGGPNYDFCETYVLVQDNMFNVCPDPSTGVTVSGTVATEDDETVEGVQVALSGQASMNQTTPNSGAFSFSNLQTGYDYTVTPQLDVQPLNGVSTFDLVLISKHILGVQPLGTPYKLIAADANNSKTITTQDLIAIRRLILSVDTEFANNTSWRFVPASYAFPVATNPWFETFPEVLNINDLPSALSGQDFVGVKIGDVNGSAAANLSSIEERTMKGLFTFGVEEVDMKAGNTYTVAFTAQELSSIQGYQATLTFGSAVELVDVVYGAAGAENFGMRYASEGMITTSWNGEATGKEVMFSLVLRAKADAQLSEVLGVSSRYTVAEAYNQGGELLNVGINFSTGALTTAGFELYQNTPNPFKGETLISWNQPEDAEATLTISDVTGKVLKLVRTQGAKGYNTLNVRSEELGAVGVLSYTISTNDYTATKKMVIIE